MNKNVPNNQEDQEIDLSQISRKIGSFFEWISARIFSGLMFFIRNRIIVSILLVVGISAGWYLDKTQKNYNHQIIVTPNFGSNDYLYSKINLLNSKIKENDTIFLKENGFSNAEIIKSIEVEPIIDVYQFTAINPQNFELLRLMSEDGDLNKIMEDEITSKNYPFHQLLINSSKKVTDEEFVNPLLNYLNISDYFLKVQKERINITKVKMNENDSIIKQIDDVLNSFKNNLNKNQRSSNLVYFNENTQLNDIIKTKNDLIAEQGSLRLDLINYEKIIKEVSIVTNIKNTKSINGKMKFVMPVALILLFIFLHLFIGFYRKQAAKSN
jgi:uncharacterized membrane protein